MATATWLPTIETSGFERRFTDPTFIEQTGVIPLVHGATGQSDLLPAFDAALRRSRR